MLRVVKTIDDLVDLRDWFDAQGRGFVALDTETTGVDTFARDFQVRIIQFGNTKEAWVVPFEPWTGPIQNLIDRFPGTFLIHNSSFDVQACRQREVDIPWHKVRDTMIAMRLIEPHRTSGLKDAATRHVSRTAGAGQADLHKAMRTHSWTWATIPIDFPAYVLYAAMDVILTARLNESKACSMGFAEPLYQLEMDVRQVCSEMERNGMRVDLEFCHEKRAELVKEIDLLRRSCEDDFGINLTSNGDLSKWLLTNGVPLTKTTAGGAPSVDKDSLESVLPYISSDPKRVVESALRVRKLQKLTSNYYEKFINLSTDGLLHPSIETVQAKTGRMSIRNPALQTLPRVSEDPDSKTVRKCVVPRNDDEVLIACDYSQIELRCIATFSGDVDLQDAFHASDSAGTDFFLEATKAVYGDSSITKADPRRNGVKTLFYASGYGAGVKKMAATAGIPVNEMQEISGRVFSKYPGVKRLMKAAERIAKENHDWITTPAGRRIWIDPEIGYKAMNGLVQGHATDVFKKSLVNMAQAGLSQYFVLPIHDEILLSVPEDQVDDVSEIVGKTMTDLSSVVPLLAEPGRPSLTWAEAK